MPRKRREFLAGASRSAASARGVKGKGRQNITSVPGPAADVQERLQVWMRFGQPLEIVIGDFLRVFDAWEAMGVNGIVVGRMCFREGDGQDVPVFHPNPHVYSALGVPPPQAPAKEFPDRRRQLDRTLDEAKRRKWPVLIFAPEARNGKWEAWHYPFIQPEAWAARILDTLSQFPQADGAIIDGPEWSYEISTEIGDSLFNDLPDSVEKLAESMQYDFSKLRQVSARLYARLHQLGAEAITSNSGGGSSRLFHSDPELALWMQFRTETLTATVKRLKGLMTEQRKGLRLGMGPRTPAFAPLCGYDYPALLRHLEYVLPKHYFWHRGFDGLYGTVYRWMRTIMQWNPGLSDAQALEVVKAWFGLELPRVESAFDFERGFPDEFFSQVVRTETQRALAASDSPERIIPWVDMGRRPHAGDPMGTGDFLRMLEASREAGLRRFVYHGYTTMTPGEAEVMRVLCGGGKQKFPGGWAAPDMDAP